MLDVRFVSPRALAAVVVVAFLAGCSAGTSRPKRVTLLPTDSRTASVPSLDVPNLQALPLTEPSDVPTDVAPDANFDTEHPEVADFLDQYRTSQRDFMENSLERASKHLLQVQTILAEEGVPPELAYLPIIESGFRLNAVSHAGAAGPWQFMRHTGKRYGLRIDRYVDERRDLVKATRAAARYLRDLHDMFGDWHLSLAAYNSGEGKINQVLELSSAEDFWAITDGGYLPRETSEFVPRFIAAMEIAMSPEEYGFYDVERHSPLPVDSVMPPGSISLSSVARLTGTDLRTIEELNPALNRGIAPSGYPVLVPRGTGALFRSGYATLSQKERTVTAKAGSKQHRVRRGETVSTIARRYGVSSKALMQANRIRNANSVPAGKLLRIPTAPRKALAGQRVASTARKSGRRYD